MNSTIAVWKTFGDQNSLTFHSNILTNVHITAQFFSQQNTVIHSTHSSIASRHRSIESGKESIILVFSTRHRFYGANKSSHYTRTWCCYPKLLRYNGPRNKVNNELLLVYIWKKLKKHPLTIKELFGKRVFYCLLRRRVVMIVWNCELLLRFCFCCFMQRVFIIYFENKMCYK